MKTEEAKQLSPIDRLIYWITERESIRLKKEAGEPLPWTDDEILQRYRFTNVRRMDDRVSRWLLDNWYLPNYDHPNALIACALARFFNLPFTLEQIGYPLQWNPERVRRIVRYHQRRGRTVFNGAYIVRGNEGVDKVGCVVNYTLQPLSKMSGIVDSSSMQRTWERLILVRGIGPFMAGQVVADLRRAATGDWKDRLKWAPKGPGSARGLNRLLERPVNAPIRQEEFAKHLRWLAGLVGIKVPTEIVNRLEMMDLQNVCCELDKYERVLWGEGRPKQRYPGTPKMIISVQQGY